MTPAEKRAIGRRFGQGESIEDLSRERWQSPVGTSVDQATNDIEDAIRWCLNQGQGWDVPKPRKRRKVKRG